MTYDKNPSADLQVIWHNYVANLYSKSSILDIGSGLGQSKKRLSINKNEVITLDTNRMLMDNVDLIEDISNLNENSYDHVTAFDVIEHAIDTTKFIDNVFRITKQTCFITTPNNYTHPRNWHFTPRQFLCFFKYFKFTNLRFFVRQKGAEFDIIEELDEKDFLIKDSYALGIMGYKL